MLGPYEILSPLGKGGMGEVYRAKDTKLDREVAIKVLPDSLARDPERMARFEREAKVLASLNHPNIATIYGLEQSPEGKAIAMELVDGATLKSPLPLSDALRVAIQIAEALEAAHEKGITHRDLKPANIMVTNAGFVKVLDFGLAATGRAASGSGEDSPTFTMAMTEAGAILGTAAYMSPEQAAGKTVDKRADMWSFGVVLYETLTGKRLFSGETVSHTLADVLREPIDFSKVNAPAPIRELLERCVDRDVKTRLRDIGEARIAIRRYLADPKEMTASVPARSRSRQVGSWAGWAVTGMAVAGAGFLAWRLGNAARPTDRPLTRFSVDLGSDAVRARRISAVLSPDGTRLVYTARASDGTLQLHTRRLDQSSGAVLTPLDPTLDPQPFFSPNGEWIGFRNGAKIMKVSAQGGSAVTLGATPGLVGASWGDDNNIILGTLTGLFRMPVAGGTAQLLKQGAGAQTFPQVLPGAKAVVFNAQSNAAPQGMEEFDIEVLEFATGQKKTLLHGGYSPRYLPTSGETGHLVYMHEGALFGVAFDPKRLQLLGTPTLLLDDVAGSSGFTDGGGQFAFSNTGTFVYLSGQSAYPLLLLDAAGKTTPAVVQPGLYGASRFSPDGRKLAYIASGGKGVDVWVYDLDRRVPTQLTFQGTANHELAWAPDSRHLAYSDGAALWWMRADGSGQAQMLCKTVHGRPGSFSPADSTSIARLVFAANAPGLPDIFTLPMDLSDPERPKPGKAEPFRNEPTVVEVDPAFSPDGRFIAYASDESGEVEVWVRPFPGPGGKWKVSPPGGQFPAWSAAAHELLFLGIDDRIMAVSYSTQGDSFSAGTPRVWSPVKIRRNGIQQNFDVSPDGKRVAMFPYPEVEAKGGSLHATFLLNFFDEVRRKAPLRGK